MTGPEMRPERDDAIRAMLLEHVRTEPVAHARRRRNRIIGWGGLGVLAIGVGATAGAVMLSPAPVTEPTFVQCLSSAERNPDGTYPGSGAAIAEGNGLPTDPIEICTMMWEQGVFEEGFEATSASPTPGHVPEHLQLCVMDDGVAAVVPSSNESICAALGLADPAD